MLVDRGAQLVLVYVRGHDHDLIGVTVDAPPYRHRVIAALTVRQLMGELSGVDRPVHLNGHSGITSSDRHPNRAWQSPSWRYFAVTV